MMTKLCFRGSSLLGHLTGHQNHQAAAAPLPTRRMLSVSRPSALLLKLKNRLPLNELPLKLKNRLLLTKLLLNKLLPASAKVKMAWTTTAHQQLVSLALVPALHHGRG